MAGETTALITFAHRSVFEEIHGPAGSRIWRPGYVAAMVEKHVPVWVVTPIAHAAHSYPRHQIVLCNPDITGPLEMDLMPLMASLFDQGNQALKSQAEREELLHSEAGTWWINSKTKNLELEEEFDENGEITDRFQHTKDFFPSGKIYEQSFKIIADKCRISVMRYPGSLITDKDIIWMRSQGMDVDEFVFKSAGISDL
jgi:hypothetical protein